MFTQEVRKEIEFLAEMNGWNPSSLLAVVEVESAGTFEWSFNGKTLPPIRFEGHYFHRRLKGNELKTAVAKGLAHPHAGAVKNPNSYAGRYELLERAKAINEQAALESTSVGLGQVMGAWWNELEYDSVQAMFTRAEAGVAGQVELMARYVEMAGLGYTLKGTMTMDKARAFSSGYNGKNYARYGYHTKIYNAARRWSDAGDSVKDTKEAAAVYSKEWNMAVQKGLKRLGYDAGNADGMLGKKTKAAVREFQQENGIVVDGTPGPMTRNALKEKLAEKTALEGKKDMTMGAKITAPTVAVDAGRTLLEKVTDIQMIGIGSTVLDAVLVCLTVAGVGLMCYGLYKQFTKENDETINELGTMVSEPSEWRAFGPGS